MQYLIDQAGVFPARAAAHSLDLGPLADGDSPRAMFITCSDSRIVPALITGARPGDLFELRTYGAVIPRFTPHAPAGESRTIDHAVEELKVTDIIVCGHSHCDLVETGIRTSTAEDADGAPSSGGSPAPMSGDLTAAGHCHVLTQLDVLSDYPSIAPRLVDRSLRLHGWFYEIDSGATLEHRPRANAFLPL
ncbi:MULTISPECIES: carbonic anhydrase [unclassified Streptomyces]|uniref:carbonic anhydrase n=1 Tax=unclassified Streptomyces TaxID=2593676 RepID=UPI002E75BF01|nr:carbonic anhydrase [Streptomyces sp. JV176]MEE1801113.1 carbonic anhydrase [Streptomyces sp. JV176]